MSEGRGQLTLHFVPAAYRALSDEAARDYKAVKEAILDALDITPETFRRWFTGTPYNPGVRLRALAQELKEACRRRLQPEKHSKEDVLDTIVLEQFLHVLPGQGRWWVMRHRPTTLNEAVSRIEDFLAAESPRDVVSPKSKRHDPRIPGPGQAPGSNLPSRVPAQGRSRPQVRTTRGPSEAARTPGLGKGGQPLEVRLQARGPLVRGDREVPVASSGEPAPPRCPPEVRKDTPLEGSTPMESARTDFCPDQWEDPTLRNTYEQLAAVDGVVTDPQRAGQWPHFELR
uniref:SCAN box domain-containing protein n=1 Tax=Pelusios castaneus TaxID=367368 RepID=A0A8C8RZ56_9SAUR